MTQFSDKPCNVDSVTYLPKWPWSANYRIAFRASHSKVHKSDEDIAHMDEQYRQWLAERDT